MKYLDLAVKTARKAGKLILKKEKSGFKITLKGVGDLVTDADKAAEKLIIEELKSTFPDHGFLAEESTFKNGAHAEELAKHKYIWIIDPIDGTTNFAHGLPHYGVSIALFERKSFEKSKNFKYLEGNIILGVIYLPRFDELFYAVKGKGAYKNGKKIHCSGVKKVAAALLASYSEEVNSPYFPYYAAVGHKAQGVRIFGAATVDLVNVAQGYTDGYMEFDLKPWDMAAGGLIVEEAGGRVTDLNGNLLDLFGHQILATNGKIHKEMVEIFKKID